MAKFKSLYEQMKQNATYKDFLSQIEKGSF